MRVTLVGKKKVDYTSKKTGAHVEGAELHYVYVPSGDGAEFEGKGVATLFTRLDVSGMVPGRDYDLHFEPDPQWNRMEFVDYAEVKGQEVKTA